MVLQSLRQASLRVRPRPTVRSRAAMEIVRHLLRLFAYDEWANRESLASLKAANPPPARALRFMGHIIGAEWLWLGRLKQDRASVPVWPDLTLEQCEAQLPDLARHWRDFLDALA